MVFKTNNWRKDKPYTCQQTRAETRSNLGREAPTNIGNESIERYADDLYKNSIMSNKKRLKRFIRTPSYKRLNKDYGAQLTLSLMVYKYWLENRATIRPRLTGAYVYVADQTDK